MLQWESEGDWDDGVHLRRGATDDVQGAGIGERFVRRTRRRWEGEDEDGGELDGGVHSSGGWNSTLVVVVSVAIEHREEISVSILEHCHYVRLRRRPIRRLEPLHRRKALRLGSHRKDSNSHSFVHCKFHKPNQIRATICMHATRSSRSLRTKFVIEFLWFHSHRPRG